MPQPLTKFDPQFSKSGKGLSFGHMGATKGMVAHKTFHCQHQHFGSLAMEVIAKWSFAENQLLMTVSRFVGGPEHEVYLGFSALRAKTSKLEVFRTISELLIDPTVRSLVARVLRFYASCQKRRDAVAHHAWGFLPDRDDVALASASRRD
ncbi:hypothetical protein [Thetidibacter halocola]|uniref:Uncharacterized protein n=1 Tax=Thetidibacter halocola TaxID=2827239 RepID=A0A8J8B6A4_9RHOB|nr:hypothetical protein [Thetidibacter halocola]MBS0123107.1 hypothetical protein [Thetidibacter halocola]